MKKHGSARTRLLERCGQSASPGEEGADDGAGYFFTSCFSSSCRIFMASTPPQMINSAADSIELHRVSAWSITASSNPNARRLSFMSALSAIACKRVRGVAERMPCDLRRRSPSAMACVDCVSVALPKVLQLTIRTLFGTQSTNRRRVDCGSPARDQAKLKENGAWRFQ